MADFNLISKFTNHKNLITQCMSRPNISKRILVNRAYTIRQIKSFQIGTIRKSSLSHKSNSLSN